MTAEERLVEAAERALKFLSNQVAGRHNGQHEDQLCGEALSRALRLYRGEPDEPTDMRTFANKVLANANLPPFPILPGGKFLPKRGE
jgi:hypothetical protein